MIQTAYPFSYIQIIIIIQLLMLDLFKEHGIKIAAVSSLSVLLLYTAFRNKIFGNISQNTLQEIPLSKKQSSIKPNSKIVRICLTGGPCGGKTTTMTRLYDSLYKSYPTYIVPEAATLIADSGGMLNTSYYNDDELLQFQYNLLQAQILLEGSFVQIANNQRSSEISVILCDRGLMDGKAYMKQSQWQRMLKIYNLTQKQMRDQRYDAVIHLVTAADGAEKYYTNSNNNARLETVQQALQLDGHTRQAWFGHPQFFVIDNRSYGSFEQKILSTIEKVNRVLSKKKQFYLKNR